MLKKVIFLSFVLLGGIKTSASDKVKIERAQQRLEELKIKYPDVSPKISEAAQIMDAFLKKLSEIDEDIYYQDPVANIRFLFENTAAQE